MGNWELGIGNWELGIGVNLTSNPVTECGLTIKLRSPLAPLRSQGGLIVNAIIYHRRGNQILPSGKTIIIGQRINEFIGSD